MKTKYYYPVILEKDEYGYTVWAEDIDGCNSCGDTVSDALKMVKEAMGLCLEDLYENNKDFPTPSEPENIHLENGQFLAILEFDWLEYKKKYCTKSIKKTLTLPEYLNEMAEKEHINFSAVLREALEAKLNVR